MPIVYNGTTLNNGGGTKKFGTTELTSIKYGTTEVWKKTTFWYNRGTWGNGVSSISCTEGSGAVTANASNVVLTSYGGMPSHGTFATNAKVSLTGVSTLYVRVLRSAEGDYGGQKFAFGVSTSNTSLGTNTGWFSPTSETLKTLDVSSLTGSYYIVFQDYNWNQTITDTIYEIYGI